MAPTDRLANRKQKCR